MPSGGPGLGALANTCFPSFLEEETNEKCLAPFVKHYSARAAKACPILMCDLVPEEEKGVEGFRNPWKGFRKKVLGDLGDQRFVCLRLKCVCGGVAVQECGHSVRKPLEPVLLPALSVFH